MTNEEMAESGLKLKINTTTTVIRTGSALRYFPGPGWETAYIVVSIGEKHFRVWGDELGMLRKGDTVFVQGVLREEEIKYAYVETQGKRLKGKRRGAKWYAEKDHSTFRAEFFPVPACLNI